MMEMRKLISAHRIQVIGEFFIAFLSAHFLKVAACFACDPPNLSRPPPLPSAPPPSRSNFQNNVLTKMQ